MKIAITGHMDIERCFDIQQIDNSIYNNNVYKKVYNTIYNKLVEISIEKNINFNTLELISGMARGVDEIFAKIAIENNLKLIIAVPKSIKFHKNKILKETPSLKIQALDYDNILKYDKITIYEVNENLDKGNYGFFLARNQKMVDLSDMVISYQCYDSIGTIDCIERAKHQLKYGGNLISF